VTARAGDTVDGFVRQMQVDRLPREQFIVLNGMPNEYQIKPGDQVKIVTDR
jgi:predicted Zn-dependent protease